MYQGAREQFEGYYRKQRRKQARLALQPPPNLVGILPLFRLKVNGRNLSNGNASFFAINLHLDYQICVPQYKVNLLR